MLNNSITGFYLYLYYSKKIVVFIETIVINKYQKAKNMKEAKIQVLTE